MPKKSSHSKSEPIRKTKIERQTDSPTPMPDAQEPQMPSEAKTHQNHVCETCGSKLRAIPDHAHGTDDALCPNEDCPRFWKGASR